MVCTVNGTMEDMKLTKEQARPLKANLKQQFISITETNSTTATAWLEKYKWKLEDAMNAYLSNGGGAGEIDETNKGVTLNDIDEDLVKIYEKYQDGQNKEIIDIDGTFQYLEDLGIDPEDMISLTLSYFLESPSTGIFNKSSFLTRWNNEQINNLKDMKVYLEEYQKRINEDMKEFEKIYMFTFDFIKSNRIDKTVNYELSISYWKLLFNQRPEFQNDTWERLEQWFKFVEDEYKRDFSKDSWKMFYYFVKDIISQDPKEFKDYDEMSAWPSVIDEYVEYLRENQLLIE